MKIDDKLNSSIRQEASDFSLRLRVLRKYLGLTQSDIAKLLDVTKASISAYENGVQSPTIGKLKKLVITYNVSANWLLGIDER